MANKKKPTNALVFKQPMEIEEASEALRQRIAEGKNILSAQPSSEAEFKVTQAEMNKWESGNQNTLHAITDDDVLEIRYTKDDPPAPGFLGHDFDLKEELCDLLSFVRERVGKMEAILTDLPKLLK